MKKIFLKSLLTIVCLLCSITASAYDFKSGELYYNITSATDLTAEVTFKSITNYKRYNDATGDIEIPTSVIYSGKAYSVTSIGDYAFYDCTGLTSVTIPKSVTSIGSTAFFNCTGLTSVTIPNSVTSIGESAFSCCSSLTNVILPNGITSIEEGTFHLTGLTSITIPISVKAIGKNAFYHTNLTSITIPENVTSIGEYAFYYCLDLKTICYNATACTTMGSSSNPVFYGVQLTTLAIGENVKSIPVEAFYNCSIKDLNYNATACTIIGKPTSYVFRYLKTLSIGQNVESIPDYAFYGCSFLTRISIPNGATSIGNSAFSGCRGLLYKCYVPFSVTNIGTNAFYNTNNMFVYLQGPILTKTTQTTLEVSWATNIDDFKGAAFDLSITNAKIKCNGKEIEDTKAVFADLSPNSSYTCTSTATIGGYERSFSTDFSTKAITPTTLNTRTGQTYADIQCITGAGDADVQEYGIEFDGVKHPISYSADAYRVTNLYPGTKYSYRAYVKAYDRYYYSSYTLTTKALTLTTESSTNISNTTATINGTVDCDTEGGALFGFEWRDAAASSLVESNVCYSQNINGYIANGLANLSSLREYHYRAFVKVGDTAYYGKWKGLFTSNAYAFWAPTLYTIAATQDDTSVKLSGYYVSGSDPIKSKGFRVWTDAPKALSRATGIEKLFEAGNDMTVSINLDELGDGDFNFATYVTTSTGDTYYSEPLTFTVTHTGIEDVNASGDEAIRIWYANRHITVEGAENQAIKVFTLQGVTVKNILKAESSEEFEVAGGGVYIISVNGKSTKILVK